jgi:hypothetical protein
MGGIPGKDRLEGYDELGGRGPREGTEAMRRPTADEGVGMHPSSKRPREGRSSPEPRSSRDHTSSKKEKRHKKGKHKKEKRHKSGKSHKVDKDQSKHRNRHRSVS